MLVTKESLSRISGRMLEVLSDVSYKIFQSTGRKVKLVIISVDPAPASTIYITKKMSTANKCGIDVDNVDFDKTVSEQRLIDAIHKLNEDESVDGIIVQLPIPDKLDKVKIINQISHDKDVDGLTNVRQGDLLLGSSNKGGSLIPPTAQGVLYLLRLVLDPNSLVSKNVLMIGASNIVGLPVGILLLQSKATVTVANSSTSDLKEKCLRADIIVCATGQPSLIKEDMIQEDTIVIDVGISRFQKSDGGVTIVGDVDFENCIKISKFITPVPGGVGPLTVVFLLRNLLIAYGIRSGRVHNELLGDLFGDDVFRFC